MNNTAKFFFTALDLGGTLILSIERDSISGIYYLLESEPPEFFRIDLNNGNSIYLYHFLPGQVADFLRWYRCQPDEDLTVRVDREDVEVE